MKIYQITLSEEEIGILLDAVSLSYKSAVPTEQEKLKSLVGSIELQRIGEFEQVFKGTAS